MSEKSLTISGVYAITQPGPDMLAQVEAALAAGVSILQYRDKQSSVSQRIDFARQLGQLCQRYKALFIINDDCELALEVDADGVHVGKDDGAVAQARSRLGAEKLLGVSCYNDLDLALAAEAAGADYVAFGRFFPSVTKPDAIQADIDTLRQASKQLNIPIVAIGGITAENGGSLLQAGADSLAVIHGLFGEGDVAANTRDYTALFDLPSAVHALS